MGVIGSAVLVLAVLVIQMFGLGPLDPAVNVITFALLLLLLTLLFSMVAPNAVKGVIERIETFKLTGVLEIGLQAASRAERVQANLPEAADEVEVSKRPRGERSVEYEGVRVKLQDRLRFVQEALFGLPATEDYERIVSHVEERRLLEPDELHLVRDILNGLEKEVGKLPERLQEEYLDAGWRFSVRFATLTFERMVRRAMTEANWFILDFDQARSHRPDFLAYRDDVWLLIAARVQTNKLGGTRQRFSNLKPPFGAKPLVVTPDSREFEAEPADKYPGVGVLTLSAAARYSGS